MNTLTSNIIFTQIPKNVMNHPKLSSNAKIIFAVLWDVIKDKGHCYHRNKKIAELANLSERTVARCINMLEKCGLLSRTGMSFNRKFTVGALFTVTAKAYAKVKQIKKNLHSYAKSKWKPGQRGKHTKNLPNNINKEEIEKISKLRFVQDMEDWYKNRPHMRKPD